jgi:hypothetical protein
MLKSIFVLKEKNIETINSDEQHRYDAVVKTEIGEWTFDCCQEVELVTVQNINGDMKRSNEYAHRQSDDEKTSEVCFIEVLWI